MNRDAKIEKINSYRKLLDLTLKSVTKDEEIQKEVQGEFQAWVSSQLEGLMGSGSAVSSQFTEEEALILKEFAQKTLSRVNAQGAAPAQPSSQPRPPQPVRTGSVEEQKREALKQSLKGTAQPRRRSTETDEQFMERLTLWEEANEI